MPQQQHDINHLFINNLQSNSHNTHIVERCGNHNSIAQHVEIWGIYRYTKPVLLWRGKGKMEVFTSGRTCFLWNC